MCVWCVCECVVCVGIYVCGVRVGVFDVVVLSVCVVCVWVWVCGGCVVGVFMCGVYVHECVHVGKVMYTRSLKSHLDVLTFPLFTSSTPPPPLFTSNTHTPTSLPLHIQHTHTHSSIIHTIGSCSATWVWCLEALCSTHKNCKAAKKTVQSIGKLFSVTRRALMATSYFGLHWHCSVSVPVQFFLLLTWLQSRHQG